jgi:hypothetical protein
LTAITYPDGYVVNYDYGGIDAAVSRPTLIWGNLATPPKQIPPTLSLESFKYLGAGTVVERSRPEVNVTLSMTSLSGTTGDAGDKYTGLDRFGRVVDQRWTQGTAATSPVVDRLTYTYDRNGNRLTRTNALAAAFSERYSYDALNQLQSFARTGGTTKTQQWQFDALGNWTSVTTNSVEQKRTANAQNEVTKVGGKSLAYSATGNVATDEQGRTLVYDGWNRLAAVQTSDGTEIARYEYDGLNRRIVEQVGSPTFAAPVRDVYYSLVMMTHYVKEEDPQFRAASNAMFERLCLSMAPEVAGAFGHVPIATAGLEQRMQEAIRSRNWPLVGELAKKLAQQDRQAG